MHVSSEDEARWYVRDPSGYTLSNADQLMYYSRESSLDSDLRSVASLIADCLKTDNRVPFAFYDSANQLVRISCFVIEQRGSGSPSLVFEPMKAFNLALRAEAGLQASTGGPIAIQWYKRDPDGFAAADGANLLESTTGAADGDLLGSAPSCCQ
jgi:hypothetical protein